MQAPDSGSASAIDTTRRRFAAMRSAFRALGLRPRPREWRSRWRRPRGAGAGARPRVPHGSLATTRSKARLASRTSSERLRPARRVRREPARAARAGDRRRTFERFADRASRALFVVVAGGPLFFDGGAGHVPETHLPLAEGAAEGAELARADRRCDNRAERVSLAVFDPLRELDLAFAGEERHARELLEVRGYRVRRGVAADRLKGKGVVTMAAGGKYGVTWRIGLVSSR